MLLKRAFDVPIEDVFGRRLFPALDEGAEQIVVVRIEQRIALALVDVLRIGQFGARHDVDRRLRHNFALEDMLVHVACKVVDLMLPKVGEGGEEARLVAVERRVADARLRLVRVAREAAAEGCGEGGEDARAAVARLDVLGEEGGDGKRLLFARLQKLDGRRCNLLHRVLHGLLDGEDGVIAAEVFGERVCEILRRLGVETAWHVDEQDVFRAEDSRIERSGDGGVDAARGADDDLLHADAVEKISDAVGKRFVNLGDFGLLFGRAGRKRGDFLDVDIVQPFLVGWSGGDA